MLFLVPPQIPASPENYVCNCPPAYGGPHPALGPDAPEVDLYRRVSLVKAKDRARGREEVAVERQTYETCAMCHRMGMKIVRMWTDNDISATSGKYRPAFEGTLLHPDTRTIVTYHTDRYVRLNVEMTRVEKRGLTVYGVHSSTLDLTTPYGVATAVVQTAFAEAEGKQKALRQKSQNRQAAVDGEPRWYPRVPFGYTADQKQNPAQAAALKKVYENLLLGASMGSQVRWLNEQGLISNTGAKWKYGSLRHVLVAHRNAGIRTYTTKKLDRDTGKHVTVTEEVGLGTWEPIVPEETYRAVVQLLKDPKRLTAGPRNGKVAKYLVTGLARCGKCGDGIHAHKVTRREPTKEGRTEYRYYTCRSNRRCCNHDMEFVDSYVIRKAFALLTEAEFRRVWDIESIDTQPALIEKARLNLKIKQLGEQFAMDEIPIETMIAGTQAAKKRIKDIDSLLVKAGSSAPIALLLADTEVLWQQIEDGTMDLDHQRQIIAAVFSEILLMPRNRARVMSGEMIKLTPRTPATTLAA